MKMAKASEKDICAAADAMSVLSDISSGYYPKREGDDCDDTFFDPDEPSHLRKFYDLMNATLDTSPGWPGRVIGGMCFVILYDKNQIIDPAADTLELHPRFAEASTQRDELLAALKEIRDFRAANDEWDGVEECIPAMREIARAAIAKAEGGAA